MNEEENESVRLSDELPKEVPEDMNGDPRNIFKECPCYPDGKHVFSIRVPKLTLRLIYLKCKCGAYIVKPM
jgi:hypothetical protein